MKIKILMTIAILLAIFNHDVSGKSFKNISYEIGVNNYHLIRNDYYKDHFTDPSQGISPNIAINYHFPESGIPITAGIRFNIFKIDFEYESLGYIYEPESIQYTSQYFQFQFPIAYNFTFKNSELASGFSPSLYINTYAEIEGTFPENSILRPNGGIRSLSRGLSYEYPRGVVMNCDIFVHFTQYFINIKDKKLGIKAFLHFPMLKNEPIRITSDFQMISYEGESISYRSSYQQGYKPLVYGFSLIFR